MRLVLNRLGKVFLIRTCCVLVGCLLLTSCVKYVSTVVNREDLGRLEKLPAESRGKACKVHLVDGSMVLFREGFELKDSALVGIGTKYDLTRTKSGSVWMVPRDSVASVLCYRQDSQTLQSIMMSFAVFDAFGVVLLVLLLQAASEMHG